MLRATEWSESSQIVSLFTRSHGKIRGLAKGAKRLSPSSVQRFTGGFDLLTIGRVTATTRPSTDLAAITEWDVADTLPHLRRSLVAQRIGCVAASYVEAMTADEDAHPALYEALLALLDSLREERSDDVAESPALLRFQWALLTEVGYQPELKTDILSGDELGDANRYTFDPAGGGFSVERQDERWRVRRETRELLLDIAAGDRVAATNAATVARANRLLTSYLREILGREANTMQLVLRDP